MTRSSNSNPPAVPAQPIEVSNGLSLVERGEIDELLKMFPMVSSAAIDALKIIQKHRRWVSDQALIALARYLAMPVAELDSIASFYNQIFRKPVGENLVHPCNGVSCMLMGSEQVQGQLYAALGIGEGETTADGKITLISNPCLGACDKAPVLRINDQLHEKVQPDEVAKILQNLNRTPAGRDQGQHHG